MSNDTSRAKTKKVNGLFVDSLNWFWLVPSIFTKDPCCYPCQVENTEHPFRNQQSYLAFIWAVGSSTCPMTGFFWLLSHVVYLKLSKVSYECLLSQSWVMGSKTSFSVSQQLRPELSAKWMLLILSDLPLTRKTEKNVYFSILQIKLTKTSILPNCQVPNMFFWYNCKFYHSKIEVL